MTRDRTERIDRAALCDCATGRGRLGRRFGHAAGGVFVAMLLAAGCATNEEVETRPPEAGAAKSSAMVQSASPSATTTEPILLTIILRHDQSRTLDEIRAHLERTRWHEVFPPDGCEVVSWYVVMGVGQIVTLSVPPDRLRAVNLAVERSAWGAFTSEFHPSYDYIPIWTGSVR